MSADFSCAAQSFNIDGVSVAMGYDPSDSSICWMVANGIKARLTRNGFLLDMVPVTDADMNSLGAQGTLAILTTRPR